MSVMLPTKTSSGTNAATRMLLGAQTIHTHILNRPHFHKPPANILHFTRAKQLIMVEQVGAQYLTQRKRRKTVYAYILTFLL